MARLFLLVAAVAQPEPAPLVEARGAFFALSVPNAEASAKWYSEKLGLKVVFSPPRSDGVRVMALAGGGMMVELIERADSAPLSKIAPQSADETKVHGVFKAGVIVDNWDRLIASLKERGVPIAIGPFPATAQQRANLIIRDKDGNYIQFFSNQPAPAEAAAAN